MNDNIQKFDPDALQRQLELLFKNEWKWEKDNSGIYHFYNLDESIPKEDQLVVRGCFSPEIVGDAMVWYLPLEGYREVIVSNDVGEISEAIFLFC